MCKCSDRPAASGCAPVAGNRRRIAASARVALVAACTVAALAFGVAQAATPAKGAAPAASQPRFGFGKPATPEEIAGWDIDVRPDGNGLPPGKGTVEQGQAIYDEKCASCHGTFGESTDYMAIAGGVGTLKSDQPVRTIGSKLNYATTLWDYINRAMPFNAPKTLKPDEVYALTAYVLHLNDILPADGVLDRASLIAFKMPNRDGFTTDHGMMSVRGKPDTHNVACMKDCATEVKLSSEYPESARDSHGNLAEQTRGIGPVPGAPNGAKVAAAAQAAPAAGKSSNPAELAKSAGCTACHGTTQKIVGPAFRDVAARYAQDKDAQRRLVDKVKQGGAGVWGSVPMPANSAVRDEDVRALVAWILGGAK